jgi:hypothetical protein
MRSPASHIQTDRYRIDAHGGALALKNEINCLFLKKKTSCISVDCIRAETFFGGPQMGETRWGQEKPSFATHHPDFEYFCLYLWNNCLYH